jgi:hypothetical protein
MIQINLNIKNPFSDRFKNIRCWAGSTPFENKFWELQLYKSSDILLLELHITHRQDHAGVRFGLAFLGFNVEFNLHDSRHWNHQTVSWEKY